MESVENVRLIGPECPRAGETGWFGTPLSRPCKFAARYSSGAPDPAAIKEMRSLSSGAFLDEDDVAALEALAPRTYVYDICVRCGVTVGQAK